MNIDEFCELPWSRLKAYMLGLMYTRIDIAVVQEYDEYLLSGTVAHQPNSIDNDQILTHFLSFSELLNNNNLGDRVILRYNNDVKFLKPNGQLRKNGKSGFSVGIKTNFDRNETITYETIVNDCNLKLSEQVVNIPNELVDDFVIGTIDGRSSFDRTRYLVSIDIDRNQEKQNILNRVIASSSVDAEINSRGGRSDSSKADQLRYSKKSLVRIANMELLSVKRLNDIRNSI